MNEFEELRREFAQVREDHRKTDNLMDEIYPKVKELHSRVHIMEDKLDPMQKSLNNIETALIGDYEKEGLLRQHKEVMNHVKEQKDKKKDWIQYVEKAILIAIVAWALSQLGLEV